MHDGADDEEPLPPEGFDYGSVGPDPPSVETPDVDASADLEDADPDPETARLFWRLVLVFDVALFALVAGPAFWYFEDRSVLGLQVFGLGLVAFGYGVYRLRTRETGDSDSVGDDSEVDDDGGDGRAGTDDENGA